MTVGSCDHHFCRSCFDKALTRGYYACPECKTPIWQSDLKPNRAFSSAISLCSRLRQIFGMIPQKRTQASGSPSNSQLVEIFKTPLIPPKPRNFGKRLGKSLSPLRSLPCKSVEMVKSCDGKQIVTQDLPPKTQTLEIGRSCDGNQTQTVASPDRSAPNPTPLITTASPNRKRESPLGEEEGGTNQDLANRQLANIAQTVKSPDRNKPKPTETMASHNRQRQSPREEEEGGTNQDLTDRQLANRANYRLVPQFTPIPFRTRNSMKRKPDKYNTTDVNITSVSKRGKQSYYVESDASDTSETDSTESENEDELVVFVADESDTSESVPTSTTDSPPQQGVTRGRKYSVDSQKKVWRNCKGETLLHVACIKVSAGCFLSRLVYSSDAGC